VEPFPEHNHYDCFCQTLAAREGFTYWQDSRLVGIVSYSDYMPGEMVFIHVTCLPEYRRVITPGHLRRAFRYAFEELQVRRLLAYSVCGFTDHAAEFLEKAGFVLEGTLREGAWLPGGITADVRLYAMLKKECRWL